MTAESETILKKVLVINGSPRKGNTLALVKQIEAEMRNLGEVEFEYVHLADLGIELCRGCHACLTHGIEHCPINDDVPLVKRKMDEADAVTLAAPVYVMNTTGLMKNLIDRLCSICHRPEFFSKHALVACTTGGIGLSRGLNYLMEVTAIWGFRRGVKIGFTLSKEPGLLEGKPSQKSLGKIGLAAGALHHLPHRETMLPPTLMSVIQFRAQRALFLREKVREVFPADYQFYDRLRGKRYWVDARVGPVKSLIAGLAGKLALLFSK